jgi:hypothetical protein
MSLCGCPKDPSQLDCDFDYAIEKESSLTTITLLSKQPSAGPLFKVKYTINNHSWLTAAQSVALTDVGDSVNVDIPDTAFKIRLINLTPGCGNHVNKSTGLTTTTTTVSPVSTTTTAAVYTATRSADFQRNNCVSGQTGSIDTFTKTYSSLISQIDANNKANTDLLFNTEGQNAANTFGTCTADLPANTVNILVIDLFNALDVCAFVDTPGVTPYQLPVFRGNNFLPNTNTPAKNCWALASDFVNIVGASTLKYRFQFNLARLINTYPSIPEFQFKVRGRGINSGLLNGSYSLKGSASGSMTMTGNPGTYLPSVQQSSNLGLVNFINIPFTGGANGSIGLGFGTDLLTFNYNVATATLSLL